MELKLHSGTLELRPSKEGRRVSLPYLRTSEFDPILLHVFCVLRMKRGYEESASTSVGPPQSKRRFDSHADTNFEEDESTKKLARKVADHYSARTNQTLEDREASPIIHLKKLNNWIKSVLIQLYARRGDFVLDLACGKGGDLIKWDKVKVGYYVGIDIAEGSIEDCRTRYNGEADHHQCRKKFTFPADLFVEIVSRC
ncbi:hypothetical protein NE237_032937 [Protea cynaroides]|uniref:mRNA (guanine-N(7))-methyltransferase n=1 Tax=Protea cynaroides TaxID=273540 RepID=A0A9Q0L4H6_9MAGN|nr:hypothetical protein NE237_032937 [Protea cynaroides]